MHKLYKFHWDCGRMGFIDGLFVSEADAVEPLIGTEIYFGEVLGKHSEISGTLDADDVKVLSEDQDLIDRLIAANGGDLTLCGYSPLDYVEEG